MLSTPFVGAGNQEMIGEDSKGNANHRLPIGEKMEEIRGECLEKDCPTFSSCHVSRITGHDWGDVVMATPRQEKGGDRLLCRMVERVKRLTTGCSHAGCQ